jgi:ribose 1,5-bisphosphokinase
MSAKLIYVMGPSGVGKDSLLNWLRSHVQTLQPKPALHFARRTITRAAGDATEDHEAIGQEDFAKLTQEGVFALHWQAHGLHYGVRRTEMTDRSGWVIVNGSRAYAKVARERCPGMTVLHVSAPENLVRQRLLSRQRETAAEVEARVLRSRTAAVDLADGDLHIVNAGGLEESATALCQLLQSHTGLQLHQSL